MSIRRGSWLSRQAPIAWKIPQAMMPSMIQRMMRSAPGGGGDAVMLEIVACVAARCGRA